jgi:hypothetical protein
MVNEKKRYDPHKTNERKVGGLRLEESKPKSEESDR